MRYITYRLYIHLHESQRTNRFAHVKQHAHCVRIRIDLVFGIAHGIGSMILGVCVALMLFNALFGTSDVRVWKQVRRRQHIVVEPQWIT